MKGLRRLSQGDHKGSLDFGLNVGQQWELEAEQMSYEPPPQKKEEKKPPVDIF